MRKITTLILTGSLALAACGKDEGKKSSGGGGSASGNDPEGNLGGLRVADEESLPECDESAENLLVFVDSTKTFRVCSGGTWETIDLRGLPGEKGATGPAGAPGANGTSEVAQAIKIYKAARKSVFRVEIQCTFLASPAANCPSTGTFLGSAFLCGEKKVCTNAHVVTCTPLCFSGLSSLKLQQVFKDTDSVNDTGRKADETPSLFFETNNDSGVEIVQGKDLATIAITENPPEANVLKLATKAWNGAEKILKPILSLSFPLGLQDLYVDLGYVNTPAIGECYNEGGLSGYGCPKDLYDFATTNDTDHGSSGSPLFDVETGEVVGVTSAGTEGENANYTWAIDASLY